MNLSTEDRNDHRLYGIQLLRAVAAVIVVFTHSITRVSFNFPKDAKETLFRTAWGDQWTVGDVGVDLFFVISGFIMFYVHRMDFGVRGSISKFLTRRIKRIFPLYWLLTTVAILLIFFLPAGEMYSQKPLSLSWVVASYFLLPIPNSQGIISPVIGVGWTLVYEVFFYAIFALALNFKPSIAATFLYSVILFLVVCGVVFRPSEPILKFATSFLLLDFLGGVHIARMYAKKDGTMLKSGNLTLCICICVILLTVIAPPPETGVWRFILWGIPSIFIVRALCWRSFSRTKIQDYVLILAEASYSIYLFQVFALPFGARIIDYTALRNLPFDFRVIVLALITTLMGVMFWVVVEKNIQLLINSLKVARPSKTVV